MINKACAELMIESSSSWLIGDSTTDIETAQRAGLKSVLVQTGYAGKDGKFRTLPQYEFPSVMEATQFILTSYPKAKAILRKAVLEKKLTPGSIISISGPSRSGKTHLTSLLRELLLDDAQSVQVLPLDSWILPVEQRGPGFTGRHDFASIEEIVRSLVKRDRPLEVSLPIYDRQTRTRSLDTRKCTIKPEDFVLVEGVTAGVSLALQEAAHWKVFVNASQDVRRHRFLQEYRLRGWQEFDSKLLFLEREKDELPAILATQGQAEWIFSWDKLEDDLTRRDILK